MAAAGRGLKVLMATGEEPVAQVAARARRIGRILPESLFVMRATDISTIFTAAQAEKMDLVVLDSVQTVTDPEVVAPSGSPGQVRAVAQAMVALGKTTGAAVLIVGHVTKDGALAGPKFLEHLVDSVLSFEGQGGEELRVLRVNKHRFGTTTDVALFRMGPSGLAPLADPSGSFLRDRQPGLPGSAVLAAMIGTRPTLVEVQALVAYGSGQPRRVAQGLEVGRLALVLAVLEQRAQVDLASMDVYASVTGGIRVSDPGIDMAVALAVASAFSGVPLPATLACAGEIGLGGEIRQVAGMTRRWAEATRLGFDRHIGPPGGSDRSASRADIVGILNDLDLRPEIRPRLRPADSGQFRRVGG
jgi:DNA repair protein RadA/Sms